MSSAYFFRLVIMSGQLMQLTQLGITTIMFAVILVQEIYGKSKTIKHNFKYPVFLIFVGVFLSMVAAQSFHNQDFVLTFWAQSFMYYYLFYFFLHIISPDIRDLEKILLALGIGYAILYLVQYSIYPTTILDVRFDVDRGTIRIFIPGSTFMGFALFMSLDRFYKSNKIRYILFAFLFIPVYILTGTRYSISITFLVVIASLLFSKIIRSRYVIYFLFVISVIPVYLIFQDIFNAFVDLTRDQSENFESDIRIRAATFFLTEFFPNTLAYLFGNGQDHMRSLYGIHVNIYKITQGFYQSDVGFIGEFSKFGLFFATGAIWLLLKALRAPLKSEYAYIKYRLLVFILVLPVGSTFTNPASIATLCIIMYIIDKNIHELKQESIYDKLKEDKKVC